MAGLDVWSLDSVRKIITIVQGKGEHDRVLPVGERARWWLERYISHVRPENLTAKPEFPLSASLGFDNSGQKSTGTGQLNASLQVTPDCKAMFLAMDGVAGLTASGITMAVVPYLRAAGIDKGSCHLFRHAMATQMLENGADLRWIQAMLGHSSVESPQIYAQVSIRALQAVHVSTHPAEQRENPEEAAEPPDSP